MSGGFGFGVESSLDLAAACFARTLVLASLIEVFSRKRVSAFAVSLRSPYGSNGRLSIKKRMGQIGNTKNLFNRFSVFYAPHNGGSGDTEFFGPFGGRKRGFSQGNQDSIFAGGGNIAGDNLSPRAMAMTGFTAAPLAADAVRAGIFRRKFVAPFTMRLSPVLSTTRRTTKFKAADVAKILFGKSQFNGHTPINALLEGAVVKPNFSGPLPHRLGFAVKSQIDIGFKIILLFLSRSPAAIFRGIAFRAVHTINGLAWVRRPHISQERFKIQPPVTDGDACATIPEIARVAFGRTAGLHSKPNGVGANNGFNIHGAAFPLLEYLIAPRFGDYNGRL